MTDLTEPQRIYRAARAKRAMEEFIDPALAVLKEEYGARMIELASRTPWEAGKITALANALRIAEEVENQVKALIYDGEHAKAGKVRADRIEKLTPARRRLLGIAPF